MDGSITNMTKLTWRLVPDRVVLKVHPEKRKSALTLPEEHREDEQDSKRLVAQPSRRATVIMVGAGVQELQAGDEVFVNRRGYQSLTMEDGASLHTCREADVYAKLTLR
jgi:hypothetical protein